MYKMAAKKTNKKEEKPKKIHHRVHHRVKHHTKKYVVETRKAVATAILAAFGFLMALSWREVIAEWVDGLAEMSLVQGRLFEALMVTLISVLGILIVTKFIAIQEENK